MNTHDPLGYYTLLEVSRDANEAQLKAAYRRRAMALHPDRNPGQDTTEQFQALNEAFGVLSDPTARAAYDTPPRARPAQETRAPEPSPEPVKCSNCGQVSAQPRVVIYRTVKSFLLVTLRKPISGVFCSECAHKKSVKASAITWLLGWWGIPWGPVYTVQALLDNMFGGTQPPLENARLLTWQAYCFYSSGRHDIAFAVAEDALKFSKKIRPTSRQAALLNERDDLQKRLKTFLAQERPGATRIRLKNSWKIANRTFPLHAGAMALVAGVIALIVLNMPVRTNVPPKGPMPYSAQPLSAGMNTAPRLSSKPESAAYTRPSTTPNGEPWPTVASYLPGVAQTRMGGHCEVTVDNSQNTSDVFVKLVSLADTVARPARQVYIPAGGRFTIRTVEAGRYDVRYQDLVSGQRSRSDGLILSETTDARGTHYSVATLTLFKSRNGNMAAYDLAPDEF